MPLLYFLLIFSFLIPVCLQYLVRVLSSVQYQELLYANSLGGGCTVNMSGVNCKQQVPIYIQVCICIYIIYTYIYAPRCQVQRVRTSIHLHIYIPDLVPGAAIYQLSGGGVLPTARIYSVIYTWYQLLVQCTRVNKYKKSSTPNKCLVPGTAFFVPYFLLLSYFLLPCPGMVTVSCSCPFVCAVPGAAICQLSGGGCTINISSANCKQQAQKSN